MDASWYEPIILPILEKSYIEMILSFPPGFIPINTAEQSYEHNSF